MSHPFNETWIDKQIREAQECGEFDNLPGAGKPLTNLGDPNDPDWWIRDFVRRENLDMTGALPGPLALRKEAAGFPESLADVRTEAEAREILEDFNRRVKADRLRPAVGNLPPLISRTVDVDEIVEQWRGLRTEIERRRRAASPPPSAPETHPRRRWWLRRRGLGSDG